jgi:carboxymethylenebutenolidase
MQKNVLTALVLIVAVIVGYFLLKNTSDEGSQTNLEDDEERIENQLTTESDVAYFTNAKGYFVRPRAEGTYPGVVMIHENRGLRPEIREQAEVLAKNGYMVLAVDLFEGKVLETQEEASAVTSAFNQETGTANLRAAAMYLRDKGATKIGSLGWCFGGKQSLLLATSGEQLSATVVYYGGGLPTTVEELRPIKWPVLGIFGDKDAVIPVETVRKFEASLDTLDVTNEIHIYPGVGHAFANPSNPNYAEAETRNAWGKTLAFLEDNLK